ncbi:unnamed protein product, partial [Ectocarpus sp. 8 AP-2014]
KGKKKGPQVVRESTAPSLPASGTLTLMCRNIDALASTSARRYLPPMRPTARPGRSHTEDKKRDNTARRCGHYEY